MANAEVDSGCSFDGILPDRPRYCLLTRLCTPSDTRWAHINPNSCIITRDSCNIFADVLAAHTQSRDDLKAKFCQNEYAKTINVINLGSMGFRINWLMFGSLSI